jgi:hypothetical protein
MWVLTSHPSRFTSDQEGREPRWVPEPIPLALEKIKYLPLLESESQIHQPVTIRRNPSKYHPPIVTALHSSTRFNISLYFFKKIIALTLSNPTSDLLRQYDFPVLLRCRKTSDRAFVAFVCPLSEPVRRFFSCSTDFSQQIAQVVLFLFLHVFLF